MTRGKRAWILLAVLLGIGGTAVVSGILVLRSTWFMDRVRDRIVAEVTNATGGATELEGFRFDWKHLRASANGFVLHGKEKPGEPPFVRARGVEVGLKLISAFRRDVDIATLIVERPEVHIIVYPDGSNNIPEPRVKRVHRPLAEQLLSLAVRHFEMRDGMAHVGHQEAPFDLRGDNLRAVFNYDSLKPAYRGRVTTNSLRFETRHVQPVVFDLDSDIELVRDEMRVHQLQLRRGDSWFKANGRMFNWNDPRAALDYQANARIADVAQAVKLPIGPTGEADVRGSAEFAWGKGFRFELIGAANARGLSYRDANLSIAPIAAAGTFRLDRDGVTFPQLDVAALGGRFRGPVSVTQRFERLSAKGAVDGFSVAALLAAYGGRTLPWNGVASGPVEIGGRLAPGPLHDFVADAKLHVSPTGTPNPIQGDVNLRFDQRGGVVELGESQVATGVSQVQASGTLGRELRVRLETANLDDVKPAIQLLSPETAARLPVALNGGRAIVEAAVRGPLADPAIDAHVSAGPFRSFDRNFDSAAALVHVTQSELAISNFEAAQRGARVTGSVRLALDHWKAPDSSPLTGAFKLTGGDVEALLKDAGQVIPVSGAVAAVAQVTGTYAAPAAGVELSVERATAWGESVSALHASAQVSRDRIIVANGEAHLAAGLIKFQGGFVNDGGNWERGTVQLDVDAGGVRIEGLKHLADYRRGFAGLLTLKAAARGRVSGKTFSVEALDGRADLANVTRGKAPFGSLSAEARSRASQLDVTVNGLVRQRPVKGSAAVTLIGDYPARGELQLTGLSFADAHDIAALGDIEKELPFLGIVDGVATFSGSLAKPESLRAEVLLPRLQINSNPNQLLRAGARLQDLALRNTEPVRFSMTSKSATIQSAKFAAPDTNLEATGTVTFDSKSPWDVVLKGRVNLAILQLFSSDIAARGSAVLNTTVRGALEDPQVGGRLELRGASLYLSSLPPSMGVENANGVVTFDRNRANIEKLNAEVGGGTLSFGGFIGFGGRILLYRVQGTADQVRLRHPDGASVTLNAALSLTGTSENGLVSGTVTVVRAAFETHTDLSTLLVMNAKPLPAPSTPSEYLRGLTFDVRVESGPNLEVQNSLTRNLEAELDLRLRGNAARPTLSGDISVNQGEIQFLGNKYTVNRADVRFINPTKIEPTFDVDLETRARGITVNISFSGTMNRLNASYRSDPPLQSSDIIALLAVGRDPTLGAMASAQTRTNLLETGASTISQAVAAPVSNRLQRFFGVSRLKIDPSLTGVDNIPQARLTIEQQVSRDITLTYITNLARTQQQIVRAQWDINRQWSAIAVREENGVFGIDFEYRKRFK